MLLNDHPTNKGKLTFIGILFIPLSIYLFITLIKRSPKITINSNYIQFNNKSWKIEDIDEIALTGLYKFYILGAMDGAKIVFKDRSEKYIFDSIYSNTPQIKLMLDLLVNNNKNKPVEKVQADLSSEHFYDYKGSFLFSFNGIIYLAIIVFFIFLMLFKNSKMGILGYYFGISFILIFTILFQYRFNYFQSNRKYFRIKNQLQFWKDEIYNIEDIREVTFQAQGKAPHCLKVIFKDYNSKKYTAATLSDNTWKELQKHLEESNIKVHNLLPI